MISDYVLSEYNRLRRKGWTAEHALRAARVREQWEIAKDRDLVKVEAEPDCCMFAEDMVPDDATARERKEILATCNRDGIWIYATYARKSEDDEWELADSCGGFIGRDWFDSGYDVDMREAALDALDALYAHEAYSLSERATYAAGVAR